ncbi:MAG: hypothetical protein ACPGXL_06340 [Chitinophagales bacterium]
MTSLPLYPIFDALRQNGFVLGIEDYYVLVEALQVGKEIDREKGELNKDKTLKLCKALWFKPNQSFYEFKSVFDACFKPQIGDSGISNEVNGNENTTDKPINSNDRGKEGDKTEKENPQPENTSDDFNDTLSTNTEDDSVDQESWVKFVLGNNAGREMPIADNKEEKQRQFYFSDNYFDLSLRQMEQVCRFLPQKQAGRLSDTIDISATIQQQAQQGFLLKPIRKPQEHVVNQVYIFTDHGGSMLAFEPLANNLVKALGNAFKTQYAANKKRVQQYYFYNVPQTYAYRNKAHTHYEKLDKLYQQIRRQDSQVIIISDAGAARGGNHNARFKSTLWWLFELEEVTAKIVWLNPMPKKRWIGTTAERIARFVPMFSLTTQQELQKAINVLRRG